MRIIPFLALLASLPAHALHFESSGTAVLTPKVPFTFGTLTETYIMTGRDSGAFYPPSLLSNAWPILIDDLRDVKRNLELADFGIDPSAPHVRVDVTDGDTVLWLGEDGSIGAWVIDDFNVPVGAWPNQTLSIHWYWTHGTPVRNGAVHVAPVPEPATAMLVAIGLVAIGVRGGWM